MEQEKYQGLLEAKGVKLPCAACGCTLLTIRASIMCPAGFPPTKNRQTLTVTCNHCGLVREHDISILEEIDDAKEAKYGTESETKDNDHPSKSNSG